MAAPLSRICFRKSTRLFCAKPFSTTQDYLINHRKGPTGKGPADEQRGKASNLLSFEEFQQQEEIRKQDIQNKKLREENVDSFATLFRKSKFSQLGHPKNKYVLGKVTDVVNGDVYIDFGGKFHCVCTVSGHDLKKYQPGVSVVVQLYSFEIVDSFLGSDKSFTLLEADGILMGKKPRLEEKFYSYTEK